MAPYGLSSGTQTPCRIVQLRSFDVIIGMDWLSDHMAEIYYHEKVVRIPLLDGKVLRVLGEKPEEILIYSKTREEHKEHLGLVLELLKKEKHCEEQKNAFQTLKDKLCNAPVLTLPDG
ncbi:putative reverse transcriptase domain-containing protein [Tanacetum coccineum]